jgi:hypothetical protein
MKRFFNWQIVLAMILVTLSAVFYVVHYLVFRDMHHIMLYLIGDIAFLFLDVLIVMLLLHSLLEFREKRSILKKLNMVIGTFFIEMGTELMRMCSRLDADAARVGQQLIVTSTWSAKDFLRIRKSVQTYDVSIDCSRGDLAEIKDFLMTRRPFLLSLMENPNLLEHESFTDLLWAVFHLTDELAHRKDLCQLPDKDYQHLAGDIKRAYRQLLLQWLDYMKHLKRDYPYLFSLAIRTNPFDAQASVVIK